MADVGAINVRLTLDDGSFRRDLATDRADVQKSAGIFKTALSVGAGVLGAQLAGGVFNAAKSFLMLNANAETARNSLETVTGSAARAGELFTTLQKFAAATPFEFPELVQSSINLEAFGMKTEDWITTIGDTASAMGKSVDQVTQAVLDAATGQYERLKELGISAGVEGDKLVLRYMENGKQVVKEVDKNNKELIANTIKAIWNEKYEGAMKKQSKTFLGQWSTLKDNFKMTMQRMTGSFFEFSKGVLAEGNQFFNLFNTKLAKGLDPVHAALSALHVTLDQVFGKAAGDQIDRVLRGIVDGIGGVAGAIGKLVGDLASGDIGGFFKDLGASGIDLGNIVVKGALALGGGLLDVAGNLWGWVIGQLGFGGGSATNPITGFGNGAFGAINPTAGRPVDLGNIFVTASLALGGAIADLGGDIWGWFLKEIGVTGGGKFKGQGDGTEQQAPISLGDVFVDAVVGIGGDLKAIKDDAAGWIKTAIDWTGDKTVGVGKLIIQSDVQIQDTGSETPDQKGKTFVQKFVGGVESTADWLHNAGLWIVNNTFAGIGYGVGAVAGLAVDVVIGGLAKAIENPRSVAEGAAALSRTIAKWAVFAPLQIGKDVFVGFWSHVAQGFRDTTPDIHLPSWNLSLPTPDLSFGGLLGQFGNIGGVGSAVTGWILEKIGGMVPDVSLPSWDLSLPTPGFPDLTHPKLYGWLWDEISGLGDFDVSLPNVFDISLPSGGPGWPDITHPNFFGWIWGKVKDLGSFDISFPNVLDISTPDIGFPDINYDTIWNGIWNKLFNLGNLVLSFPGAVEVFLGNIIPHGTIHVPGTNRDISFAKGGYVNSPLALVGERGPELVALPRGSYVYTNAQTRAMMGRRGGMGASGGGTKQVVINNYGTIIGPDEITRIVANAITEADIAAAQLNGMSA